MATAKPAALITGGAKGIGRAIARRLVSSGWQVGIIDLADSGLHRAFARERDAFVIEGYVRDEDTASDAVEATIQRFHVSTRLQCRHFGPQFRHRLYLQLFNIINAIIT